VRCRQKGIIKTTGLDTENALPTSLRIYQNEADGKEICPRKENRIKKGGHSIFEIVVNGLKMQNKLKVKGRKLKEATYDRWEKEKMFETVLGALYLHRGFGR